MFPASTLTKFDRDPVTTPDGDEPTGDLEKARRVPSPGRGPRPPRTYWRDQTLHHREQVKRRHVVAGALFGVAAVTVFTVHGAASPYSGSASASPLQQQLIAADPLTKATDAVDSFYRLYVDANGRVIRTDQGNDTVSEGQAYAMFMAAAVGDQQRFRLVWTWTANHIQRSDGLLSWRWAGGAVADAGPAADADLYAAAALAMAGKKFGDSGLSAQARRMSSAILNTETITAGSAMVLAGGPWAVKDRITNSSYLAVGLMGTLLDVSGDQRWKTVAASSRTLMATSMAATPYLPSDWAVVSADGTKLTPTTAPDGTSPQYGFDAVRVLPQFAMDCRVDAQATAARTWSFLGSQSNPVAAVYSLAGVRKTSYSHPAAIVAAAAAAGAAKDASSAAKLLNQATVHDAQYPTYFGAAWIALGRLMLETDRAGGCRPGSPTV